MGIEIYMTWDGQTKAEKKRVFGGNGPRPGYIWSSIRMHSETHVLEQIFPQDYWNMWRGGPMGEPRQYDFVSNESRAWHVLRKYMQTASEGTMMPGTKDSVTRDFDSLFPQIEKHGVKWSGHLGPTAPKYVKPWVDEVWSFMQLGKKLQLQGRNPKILIA